MKRRSVRIRCICGDEFSVLPDQVPFPNQGVRDICCPSCGGTWKLAWDPRIGEIRMMPPEQRRKPTEWGLKARLTATETQDGDIWIES